MLMVATPGGDVTLETAAKAPSQQQFAYSATGTYAGRSVTPQDALGIASFYSGVNLIAKTGGTLPLEVMERTGNGRQIVPASDIAMRLRYQPNPDVPASTFWTTVLVHMVTTGNAYAAKLPPTDEFKRAPELWLMSPGEIAPYRDEHGVKRFRVQTANGALMDIPAEAIVHFRGVSLRDGLMGHSPVSAMRSRLGVSLAASEYQQRFFRQGAAVKGVLSVDGTLDKDAADTIREQWHSTYGGVENAHSIAVLDHGAKYQPVSLSNDDAQFIEQMRFGATEIAAMLNIPPAMIGADGASMTYTNAQHNDLHFLKFTLRPWLTYIEDALNTDRELFGARSTWEPRFNTDAVIRPDIQTRFQVYNTGRQMGVYSANEVRGAEGLPTREGGDEYTNLSYVVPDRGLAAQADISEQQAEAGLENEDAQA
jgi:HK97 family phage portal protein